MIADLAVDLLARETSVITGMSKTKAKTHLNRAQEAVVDLILPEKIPGGREADHHGVFENLALGEAWGLLRLSSYRRRLRGALFCARKRSACFRGYQGHSRDLGI